LSAIFDLYKKKQEESKLLLEKKGYFSRIKVLVGMATCEIAAGSQAVMDYFKEAQKDKGLNITVVQKGCAGNCSYEPTVDIIEPGKEPVKYVHKRDGLSGFTHPDHDYHCRISIYHQLVAIAAVWF